MQGLTLVQADASGDAAVGGAEGGDNYQIAVTTSNSLGAGTDARVRSQIIFTLLAHFHPENCTVKQSKPTAMMVCSIVGWFDLESGNTWLYRKQAFLACLL